MIYSMHQSILYWRLYGEEPVNYLIGSRLDRHVENRLHVRKAELPMRLKKEESSRRRDVLMVGRDVKPDEVYSPPGLEGNEIRWVWVSTRDESKVN